VDEKRTTEPHDELTQLGAEMAEFIHEKYPDEGLQCSVFLTDEKNERCGIAICGYESDMEAAVDLLIHLKAIFKVNGKDMLFAPLGRG
jgi:hypothetical protein